ncbi:MAG: sulfatase [Verrucomicrobiales bacterium]|nr:sulfatase [Verrucomicrobiales bacterium]
MLGSAKAGQSALKARSPMIKPKAKRVIFMFMQGGPSQMETFDYKPRLKKEHGGAVTFKRVETVEQPGIERTKIFGSSWDFDRYGQNGIWVSDLYPHLARSIDDVCVLNGMHTDSLAHPMASLQLHTGFTNTVNPSAGAWSLYGLGTENQNLPGFISIAPAVSGDAGSVEYFGSAFLPAIYQGTRVRCARKPDGSKAEIRNLVDKHHKADLQRAQVDLIQSMNRDLLSDLKTDQHMEGVIESYELAFRMQTETPDLLKWEDEPQYIKDMYGIGDPSTDHFARQCILARRFAEAGVRFIELFNGGWDHHSHIRQHLPLNCGQTDQPMAALIADLKARGMFDDTLIVWSGEFGRTPYEQDMTNGKQEPIYYGRGHNPYGFTTLMMGGGVKGGIVHGATDEYGYRAVEGKVHVHDLHATMLHLLGLDHENLTYRYGGRDYRLTDVYGRVVDEILT